MGDASDASFLARAFAGAETAYTLIPPDVRATDFRAHQDRVGEATVQALRQAGVKRVVFLSSVGADLPAGTGPIAGLHAQEERLRKLGVAVLLLRPGYFFENLHASLPDHPAPGRERRRHRTRREDGHDRHPGHRRGGRGRASRPATSRASRCATCSARATSPWPR